MSDIKVSVEYVGSLFGHNGWVTALTVGQDSNGKPLLVSGSRDKTLIVWNLNLENPVEFVAGEQIVDKEVKEIKDYKVGSAYKSLKGHSHFVSCLAMSRDSKYIVSGSWGNFIF
jgi:guanine nucleotide-binding protein subunit beta-2-like 1 protein